MRIMKNLCLAFLFLCFTIQTFGQDVTIESIYFVGNKKTKTSFLESLIKAEAGQKLDSLLIEKDMEQLKRMPSIGHAYYQVEYINPTQVKIKYGVHERFTLLPEFNLWSSKGRTWYKVGAHEYNFLGENMAIGGYYQYSGKPSYGINFRAPYLFSNKMGMSANFSNWESEEPLYFNENVAQYDYKNTAIEAVGIYEPNFSHKIEFGGSFFNEKYTFISSAKVDTTLPRGLNINKVLLKSYYQWYNIKQHYQYQDGFSNDLSAQAVFSRYEDFLILNNDFKFFARVRKKGNIAMRLRVGVGSNADSPFSPFVIDNHENVRGVGDRINRGTATLTFNVEYRHTLLDNDLLIVQGAGFSDYSTLREPALNLDELFQDENLYATAGLGLRFTVKKIYGAVLRIDYGKGLNPRSGEGFVFGLGQYF